MERRTLLAAGMLLATPRLGRAQSDWPGSRPVRIIHPSVAGGPGDIYTRQLAEHLSRSIGGTFVVENRVGGTGAIGTGLVANAPADGWTWLSASNTSHVVAPLVLRDLPFDPVRQFTAVAGLYRYGMMLIVAPRIPATTTAAFVAWAKAQPQGVTLASVGTGSVGHMMAERFRLRAGFPTVHVPYRGGPPAMLAIAQGEADYIFDNIGNSGALLRDGKVRGLALTGAARAAQMPDVPTLAEAGFPGFLEEVWFGLYAPAGMPPALIARMNAETNRWLETPAIRARMAEAAHVAMPGPPEAMAAFWAEDRRRWAALVAETGVRID